MRKSAAAALNDDLSSGVEQPSHPSEEDRVTIIIDESENPQDTAVFVQVNGYAYQIKRGIEVAVPKSVVNVLNDAIESRIVKIEDGSYRLKSFLRFPFRVVQPR